MIDNRYNTPMSAVLSLLHGQMAAQYLWLYVANQLHRTYVHSNSIWNRKVEMDWAKLSSMNWNLIYIPLITGSQAHPPLGLEKMNLNLWDPCSCWNCIRFMRHHWRINNFEICFTKWWNQALCKMQNIRTKL